jgi:hypothetical protein
MLLAEKVVNGDDELEGLILDDGFSVVPDV